MSTDPTAAQRAEIAEQVGVDEQYLYQCLTGRKDMKPAEAVRVERETGGRLTRRQLRSNDWWLVWPEMVTKQFPAPREPAGRGA